MAAIDSVHEHCCPLDGAALPPGRTVCHNCEKRLRTTISQAIVLQKLLAEAENPLRGGSMASATAHVAGSRPPVREYPMIVRTTLVETLSEYARVLDTDVLHLATSQHIGTNTATPVYARQLYSEVERAHHALNPMPIRTPWGPCPVCGSPLTARPHASEVVCNTCHSTFDPQALIRNITTRPGTATNLTEAQLLRALGAAGHPIPESTLRHWIHAGRLKPAANLQGRPLYPLSTAIQIVLTRMVGKHSKRKH